ncbi:unnamed protein product [Lactuca virosa]|uniref:Uncharacterized protein n=1 Tax=Lactuca virosa TaxID=75947 RepID=A0AAU9PP19_9ASTR|nr:unnamed protein product [Lactuca virosa]
MQHPKPRGRTTGTTGKLVKSTSGANRDSLSSQSSSTNRSPRTPASEKKRVGRVSELETQVAQLQEELKKTKDHLSESELCQKRAHREAEDAKKQLAATLAKLEESQQQLDEIWACEESRIQELRKISQDRDRAWESELKAVQKHHEMDSAVLAATMNENQKLKIQLQKVVESEATRAKDIESAHGHEVHMLRLELSEALDLVEELKDRLNESKESEARALELVSQTREQLEMVKPGMEKDVVELTEDGDGSDEAARVVELGSALAANAEMENELRRLKVQTEQWRKAAEMAAAMVLGDGDGKFVEQSSESFEFHAPGEKSNSPYSEDTEEDSTNKKTNSMLKKIGVLLKKGQKQFETSTKFCWW